ncbi:MAG TPA: UDP-N-acetylglucosamine 1-carboxyvinyltransferase [Candidatus Sumerlaeota bacterium]|nr:UDP-N-acetylglucosamine 1-carboxyvinyltransferase [Candidatus Sumerlaeota bacterium]
MDRLLIEGGRPLKGQVQISGAKNAALPVLAASLLADSPVTIKNVPNLMDVDTMMHVLSSVGADVVRDQDTLYIDPRGFNVAEAPYNLVRKMRASIYVMGPMIARLKMARISVPGGCVIGLRPINLHLFGMEQLGAKVVQSHGYINLENQGMKGAEFSLEGPSGSSVGATCNVMMAAVLAEGRTVIHGAAREPEVMDLVDFLRAMGASIEAQSGVITIEGVKSLHGTEYSIIPDRIEAGTYMVAAAITRGDIILRGCHLPHMETVVQKLREIGVIVEPVVGGARCRCDPNQKLNPINIRTLPYPGFPTDLQAQFMALLTLIEGNSTITETIYTERFMHVSELSRMGANISLFGATATVLGVKELTSAPVMATDLRASATLILAALSAKGETEILRVYHIDRGYERIEEKLAGLGATIRRCE